MNDLVYNIIERQKLERTKILADSTVVREMAPRLAASVKRKLIKAVMGPRRSGKSSLVHQVLSSAKENYAYFNFEDDQLPPGLDFSVIDAALTKAYPNASIYFFDEIQIFPRWEQLLNRLDRSGKRIVISGSNSKLLSSELSSSLTGRHEVFEVFPFDFPEYCQAHPSAVGDANSLKQYLQSGGFPDVVLNRVHPQNYLRELWDAIVLKDIVQRYKVRSVTELKAVLSIFRDSLSKPLSFRSLERAMMRRLSIASVAKFISYAESAYLTSALQNFSFKTRQRVNSERKAYLIDNGFYTSMKAGAQEDYGKLLENFVFITLLRRGVKPNLDLFYYKTQSGREIDFMILQQGQPSALIQVSWNLESHATLDRELAAIADAAFELGISSAMIVTFNSKASYSHGKVSIKAVPIEEFLRREEM